MKSIEIKDVETKEVTCVDCPYHAKRRTKGFRFKAPEWLIPSFQKHIGQFKVGLPKDARFMRNHNTQSHTRIQNMGDGQVSKFAKALAERLEKPKKNACTAKSFRRSAATQLV